jgi:hypothetical protein
VQQQVHVSGFGTDEVNQKLVVRKFKDQDNIAAKVARAVRRFIREAPVQAGRSRLQLTVDVYWTERGGGKDD